jgi:eukaryotic-like serine/threonine-protein kinase
LLEDYFVTLNPPAYWKKLAFRYPAMIRELHNQMRTGVDNETAMVNSVLPAAAAHNLVLGGELLVSTTPGQAVAAVGSAAQASSGPKTIADALQIKTSYSFDQQSLEFAVRDLADDVKSNLKGAPFEFAIKIIGDDLKLDGITRNQSIRDFKQENQPVADILTALVRKANPVTTVKDPSETDQKLVWLIGPDPDNSANQIVLITTRNAAKTKKYTLPPVFVAKGK